MQLAVDRNKNSWYLGLIKAVLNQSNIQITNEKLSEILDVVEMIHAKYSEESLIKMPISFDSVTSTIRQLQLYFQKMKSPSEEDIQRTLLMSFIIAFYHGESYVGMLGEGLSPELNEDMFNITEILEGINFAFNREAKPGGLLPEHQSQSLKTNGFQVNPNKALSNSVACGRAVDLKKLNRLQMQHLKTINFETLPMNLEAFKNFSKKSLSKLLKELEQQPIYLNRFVIAYEKDILDFWSKQSIKYGFVPFINTLVENYPTVFCDFLFRYREEYLFVAETVKKLDFHRFISELLKHDLEKSIDFVAKYSHEYPKILGCFKDAVYKNENFMNALKQLMSQEQKCFNKILSLDPGWVYELVNDYDFEYKLSFGYIKTLLDENKDELVSRILVTFLENFTSNPEKIPELRCEYLKALTAELAKKISEMANYNNVEKLKEKMLFALESKLFEENSSCEKEEGTKSIELPSKVNVSDSRYSRFSHANKQEIEIENNPALARTIIK